MINLAGGNLLTLSHMITDVTHCILKCLFKALFRIKYGVNGFHIILNIYRLCRRQLTGKDLNYFLHKKTKLC